MGVSLLGRVPPTIRPGGGPFLVSLKNRKHMGANSTKLDGSQFPPFLPEVLLVVLLPSKPSKSPRGVSSNLEGLAGFHVCGGRNQVSSWR